MGSMNFRVGRPSTGTQRGALRSYRSRTIFGAVRDRGMVSALEHAGAVELSMRSWRFISGRRRCAVDRLEGPRSRRQEVVVSSCFGTASGTMKRGSGRLGAPRRRRGAPLRLGGPICCIVSVKILGCKLRTNLRQVSATRVVLGQLLHSPIRRRLGGLYDASLPSYSPPLLHDP